MYEERLAADSRCAEFPLREYFFSPVPETQYIYFIRIFKDFFALSVLLYVLNIEFFYSSNLPLLRLAPLYRLPCFFYIDEDYIQQKYLINSRIQYYV